MRMATISANAMLADLFVGLFSPDGSLDSFLARYYPDLRTHISPANTPIERRARELVDLLHARGLVSAALFQNLQTERPGRLKDIVNVAWAWDHQHTTEPSLATGLLDVRVVPPAPYLMVRIATAAHRDQVCSESRTDLDGMARNIFLPATDVFIEVAAHPSAITRLVSGPHRIQASRVVQAVIQMPGVEEFPWSKLLNGTRFLLQRRRGVTAGILAGLAILLALAVIVRQYVAAPPPGTLYVPPVDYTTGFSELTGKNFAQRVLSVLQDHAKRTDINSEALFPAAFSQGTRESQQSSFAIETTEVTVARYRRWLETLGPADQARAKPGEWEAQVHASSSREAQNEYLPVHSVTWEQAHKFCQSQGGDLPTSEQWEIVARQLKVDDPSFEGTIYPWGDHWNADVNTAERGLNELLPVGKTADKTPATPPDVPVYDLGGNLREWVRTGAQPFSADGRESKGPWYFMRGGLYSDNGKIGALTYIVYFRSPGNERSPGVGFRCVDTRLVEAQAGRDGNPRLKRYPGGKYYNLGPPKDPWFDMLKLFGTDAVYLLGPSEVHKNVGGFFVSARRVTNREYHEFLHQTDGGHGPWSMEIGTPPSYDHTVPAKGAPDDPLSGASWRDAYEYCAWRRMRLPTADEWERINRGTTRQLFPWGDDVDGGSAFYLRDDVHSKVIQSMWAVGPEWTSSSGWSLNARERIAKGLLAMSKESAEANYRYHFVTAKLPMAMDEKTVSNTFRCVADYEPPLIERWFGVRPRAVPTNTLLWPPKTAHAAGGQS